MNSCNDCRWLKITSSEYAGVGYFDCKKHYKLHPLYGKMIMSCEDVRFNNNHCDDWEQGGLKGWFQRLRKRWNYITADHLKDSRCQGCAHIDGPICPYPDECSAMSKKIKVIMEKQVLSRDQMQELIDMGIDVSKASMYWTPKNYLDVIRNEYDRDAIPDLGFTYAFTLHDILEMLPDSILGSTKQIKTVEFKLSTRGNKVYYMQDNFNQQWLKCTNGNTLLEAAFNMLKWCKENKHI